jgi:sirohydrochlorin cobaltochelatase
MTTGVMICGHGSPDQEAIDEFIDLAAQIRQSLPDREVQSGFLEFAHPTIEEGLIALRERGVDRILAIPGILFAAGHVKNDLPWEVNRFAAANPSIDIRFGRELGIDPRLLAAAVDRIETALSSSPAPVERSDTLLLVVGRGSTDPDANGNVAKVARLLWEAMGFAKAEIAYSGVTTPTVPAAIDLAARQGFKRIVVFPFFLLTGVLVKRIAGWTRDAGVRHPGIEFLQAAYLGLHPQVVQSFVANVEETAEGTASMNCQLCKYRDPMIGYEADVGAPQVAHHHPEGDDHHHDDHADHHGHAHEHGHGHGHGHDH